MSNDTAWWRQGRDFSQIPHMVTDSPGPESAKLHGRASKIIKGLSSQVKLHPVCFKEGYGVTLTDVDGNTYIDFSSGIYVTTLGHCHPRISEAVARAAHTLMNCHDFTTPVKTELLEKMVEVLPNGLNGVQLYDSGTTAVEAAIRAARAYTGKQEFLGFMMDFHGKSGHSVSVAKMNSTNGAGRAQGFYMLPKPYPYRPLFKRVDGAVDTDAFIDYYEYFLENATTNQVAALIAEPIQGWGGSVIPPDDFYPKLKAFCERHKILLIADEVLTSMGRTGKYLCMEHWGVTPDIVTIGKGFGNGFPVTAMVAKEEIKESFEKISASTSYGGNPMACAAALASIQVIEEERLLENAMRLGEFFARRMAKMKAEHKIIGDVRVKGCLLGIELVKNLETKEPFDEAGKRVYRKAFKKGLAWIPAGHILRLSPPIIMDEEIASKGMDIVDEAIFETERELGY
ncbi:MAG: aspartate aminotransferase family protein [Chloroflexi bacterium]|nr:aspartate aminotransferase family protein [Chloroflexota bacterium]MCL5273542.1 aspartate aminotransferase family protein [Chloroflexota bacterium]